MCIRRDRKKLQKKKMTKEGDEKENGKIQEVK